MSRLVTARRNPTIQPYEDDGFAGQGLRMTTVFCCDYF